MTVGVRLLRSVFSPQVEFAVDMEDCGSALREWEKLASSNPHTNVFTEVHTHIVITSTHLRL